MAVVLEKTPTNDGPRTDIQKEYIDVESDRDRGAPESSHEGTEPGVTTKTWVVIFVSLFLAQDKGEIEKGF